MSAAVVAAAVASSGPAADLAGTEAGQAGAKDQSQSHQQRSNGSSGGGGGGGSPTGSSGRGSSGGAAEAPPADTTEPADEPSVFETAGRAAAAARARERAAAAAAAAAGGGRGGGGAGAAAAAVAKADDACADDVVPDMVLRSSKSILRTIDSQRSGIRRQVSWQDHETTRELHSVRTFMRSEIDDVELLVPGEQPKGCGCVIC